MSNGQSGHLAINANAAIINTNVFSCGVEEMEANAASIRPNISTHNTAVTIVPPVSNPIVNMANNSFAANNARIQHSSSPTGEQFMNLTRIQTGNVNGTATPTTTISASRALQMTNELPVTIIAKSLSANTQKTSLITNFDALPEIDKIVKPTLPNNECLSDSHFPAGVSSGIEANVEVSSALVNPVYNKNMPSKLNAGSISSINSAMKSPSVILTQNQLPKANTTLQCVPLATGSVANIIEMGNDEKKTSEFSISDNFQVKKGTQQQNLVENSTKIVKLPTTSKMIEEMTVLPLSVANDFIVFDQEPVSVSVNSNVVTASSINNIHSCQTTIDATASVVVPNCLKGKMTARILPENDLKMNTEFVEKDIFNLNFSSPTVDMNIDKSDAMLIIDDSTDDEFKEENAIGTDKPAFVRSSPIAVTHISNSVVLTKAKPVEGKAIGTPRNLSPEPANVVLMKLPNATQQATGAVNARIEIPITEAFTLANNIDNNKTNIVKVVSSSKMLPASPENQRPTIFMRSNSIPNASQSLSPRASKRCHSLNFGQLAKLTSDSYQATPIEKEESPEERLHLNSVKTQIVPNIGNTSKMIAKQTDTLSSSDELNKENNDITFIELDDSFAEDFSEESNMSEENLKNEHSGLRISLESKSHKNSQDDHLARNMSHLNVKSEKNLTEKSGTSLLAAKIKNTNIKSFPSISNLQQSADLRSQSKHTTSMSFTNKNSDKHEKDEQITKSLLCNENITEEMPSSSSSMSSTQESPPAPIAATNHTQSNARPALTPRVRDHNRIIDANAATARRLCRDSSIASALSMVSTFDMLNWKEDRIATARGTNLRFELNEFNLLQVHERGCPPRYRIHTPYERPIYERFNSMSKADQADPLLYICRTCKLYGPAVDFLAPEFCSVECLKRTFSKRGARDTDNTDKKRARKSVPISTSKQAPTFRWASYLSNMRNAVAAPIDLFLNPFPTGPNPFAVGMKVEAIDPENCSLFCVCTIVHTQGYRLRLNFDGYNSVYDFWVNADSMDIFPPGWCGKTNRILQPPRGYEPHKFDWTTYLRKTNSIGADKKFFTHLNNTSTTNRNPFTVGMFLEADDLNDTGKLCVASVADILDERIRVHFDGWDDCYDYWVDISSPYIHPCGWHEGRQQLLVPPEYSNTSFNWRDYIRESQGLAAPTDFFVSRDPIDYRPGMKLEVVDPRNPSLIRPATVVHRTRHRVKVHFDCWPPEYTFCLEDDSPDLHPIGWCDATGHELEPPPGFLQLQKVLPCNTIGCRGIGNTDRSNGLTHANWECCPYVLENWRSKPEKTARVDGKDIIRKIQKETTTSSLLRNIKRQHNQNGNVKELSKITEKPLNIPYKQPTRGRPRNCDRLAAAAAAAAAQLKQQEKLKQTLPKMLSAENIKLEDEHDDFCGSIKKDVLDSTSKLSSTTTDSATVKSEPGIKIAKEFLCDYGPRLQQNYVLWRQNAGVDIASKVQRNPLLWSTAETCAFIDSALSECHTNTARYAVSSKFSNHDIDGAALLMLQQRDLTDILQFKIGPAVKLCTIILQLRMLVVDKYKSSITKIETEEQQLEISKGNNSNFLK